MKTTDVNDDSQVRSDTEYMERFLKDTLFKKEEDIPNGIVRLRKTIRDKQVVIEFADRESETEGEEEGEEAEEGEEGEEAEEKEESEKEEGEEGEEEDQRGYEHPFTVEIGGPKLGKDGKDAKFLFQGYAAKDGSYVVTNFTTEARRIPVPIGQWDNELQTGLLRYLEGYGVTERLSMYIHQHLDRRRHEDHLKNMEDFTDFVAKDIKGSK